jgi:hypothetical protein
MIEDLKKKVQATLKSSETEDWLDYRVVRPLSYLWALFFAKLSHYSICDARERSKHEWRRDFRASDPDTHYS